MCGACCVALYVLCACLKLAFFVFLEWSRKNVLIKIKDRRGEEKRKEKEKRGE